MSEPLYKRIKDWIVTITKFRSGDVIPVDGPSGTAKMSKDDLLKETAQNALANKIITAFDPTNSYYRGQRVIYNNYPYEAKEDVSAGTWDGTKWKLVTNYLSRAVVGLSNVVAGQYGDDFNNYPMNTIVSCTSNTIGANIAHRPNDETLFTISTFGSSENSGTKVQIVNTQSKKVFVRSQWGAASWSAWIEIKNLGDINDHTMPYFSDTNSYYRGQRVIYNNYPYEAREYVAAGTWDVTKWKLITNYLSRAVVGLSNVVAGQYGDDFNNYPMNTIVSCTSATIGANIAHRPNDETQFTISTFGSSENLGAKIQIVNTHSKKIFVRSQFGTSVNSGWSAWIEVKEPVPSINVLACFDNFVCIGDSLTACQVITGPGISDHRQAKKLWGDILAYNCNATAQTIASSGDTAAMSWPRVDAALEAKPNALAIVYLGTNQGLTDTLDEDAPASTPYTEWANTNTGCYAKIVAKAQSLGYKVMLLKNSDGTVGTVETTQAVIGKIGARFGCCVVEPFRTTENKYHYWPNLQGLNRLHYNDLGYAWFASALPYYVAKAGDDQLKYIIPV